MPEYDWVRPATWSAIIVGCTLWMTEAVIPFALGVFRAL